MICAPFWDTNQSVEGRKKLIEETSGDFAKILVCRQHPSNDVVRDDKFLDRGILLRREYPVMDSAILIFPRLPRAIGRSFFVPFTDPLPAIAHFRGEARSGFRRPSRESVGEAVFQVAADAGKIKLAVGFEYRSRI
jgi:hypothetical protein